MAEEEDTPGLDALLDCNEQVTVTIRNYLGEITKFLRKSKIIDLSLYNQVNDPTSRDPPDTKATLVYQRLQAMVQQDEKYYGIFVEYLRKSPKYEKTVKMLDEAYDGPEPVVPAQPVVLAQPPSRMSILAGCDTKSVCVCPMNT